MKKTLKQTLLYKNSKSDFQGITLISLVITIVILLIITSVSINVIIDTELFSTSKKTLNDAKQGITNTQNQTNELISEWDTIESGIKGGTYDPELDRTNIQVGDYIAYTPDTASAYSLASTESGYSSAQSIPQETLQWRVMNINEDGSVELISTTPISTTVYFNGALGYNNGVLILNAICKRHYSNASLGAIGRSLNLVDIENKMNATGKAARNAYTNSTSSTQYGGTKTYTSTYSYAPDIFGKTGISIEEESKDYYTTPTTATYAQKGSITLTQTYYNIITQNTYFDDQTFYEMVFGTDAIYWLASRYYNCYAPYAIFGLRGINGAHLRGPNLFCSNIDSLDNYGSIRPVVTLGSNVKISTTGGTAENPRTITL